MVLTVVVETVYEVLPFYLEDISHTHALFLAMFFYQTEYLLGFLAFKSKTDHRMLERHADMKMSCPETMTTAHHLTSESTDCAHDHLTDKQICSMNKQRIHNVFSPASTKLYWSTINSILQ
jgi:hypothetical protein